MTATLIAIIATVIALLGGIATAYVKGGKAAKRKEDLADAEHYKHTRGKIDAASANDGDPADRLRDRIKRRNLRRDGDDEG